jgi:geranylgeranyl reductase family protein
VNSYDTIIVGAGPAGATLGYELSRRGISVLVIEEETLPRDKTCAGGITARAASILDFDIGSVVERTTYGIRFSYRLRDNYIKRHREPFIYMVMRSKFDHLLVQKAREAGATVIDGVRAIELGTSPSGVEVITSDRAYAARIVAGADGAKGVVAKKSGMMQGVPLDLAIETRVPLDDGKLSEWESLVGIDLGQVPGGYGWVFPKKDHLSVGVGGPAHLSRRLKPYLEQILQHLGVNGDMSLKGHLMPMRRKGMDIQQERVILLGDAAGLMNPFTREGIFYAIRSAQLAAPVIEKALKSDMIDLKEYEKAVDAQLMPSIDMGRALRRIFIQSPRLCFSIVKRSDGLWEYVCRALVGVKPTCVKA